MGQHRQIRFWGIQKSSRNAGGGSSGTWDFKPPHLWTSIQNEVAQGVVKFHNRQPRCCKLMEEQTASPKLENCTNLILQRCHKCHIVTSAILSQVPYCHKCHIVTSAILSQAVLLCDRKMDTFGFKLRDRIEQLAERLKLTVGCPGAWSWDCMLVSCLYTHLVHEWWYTPIIHPWSKTYLLNPERNHMSDYISQNLFFSCITFWEFRMLMSRRTSKLPHWRSWSQATHPTTFFARTVDRPEDCFEPKKRPKKQSGNKQVLCPFLHQFRYWKTYRKPIENLWFPKTTSCSYPCRTTREAKHPDVQPVIFALGDRVDAKHDPVQVLAAWRTIEGMVLQCIFGCPD